MILTAVIMFSLYRNISYRNKIRRMDWIRLNDDMYRFCTLVDNIVNLQVP
jgi:hypothetical protein